MTTVESTFELNNFDGSELLSSTTAKATTFSPKHTSDTGTDPDPHLNSGQIFMHEPGNFTGTDHVARIRDTRFALALPIAAYVSPALSELLRLPSGVGFGTTILGAAGVVATVVRNRHLLTGERSVIKYHHVKAHLGPGRLPITASCYKALDFCETGVVSPTEYETAATM